MNVYRYGFQYDNGDFSGMTEKQCLDSIQRATGMDERTARTAFENNGCVKTPAGKFVRIAEWKDVG